MAEYIEREAALEAFENADPDVYEDYGDGAVDWGFGRKNVRDVINGIPTIDAVVVTRCKDCRSCRELNRKDRVEDAYAEGVLWCMNQSNGVWPDDFCSYGEPKEVAHADDHD